MCEQMCVFASLLWLWQRHFYSLPSFITTCFTVWYKTAFRMSAKVKLQSRQKKQCVTDTGKMLPCQVALNENSKHNLTPILHIMKILMMHERGIFLDVFTWRPLPKETGNMMWNLLSPLNWFHYGTSNYKSTIQKKRERQGVEVWAFYLAGTKEVSFQYHSLSPERLIVCGVAAHRWN